MCANYIRWRRPRSGNKPAPQGLPLQALMQFKRLGNRSPKIREGKLQLHGPRVCELLRTLHQRVAGVLGGAIRCSRAKEKVLPVPARHSTLFLSQHLVPVLPNSLDSRSQEQLLLCPFVARADVCVNCNTGSDTGR